MLSKELLDLLVCPAERTPLAVAGDALLARVNEAIAAGTLVNQAGQRVEQRLDAGLVRQDGLLLYPVVDDIPVLLVDEGIPLDRLPPAP
jgi:uncharacterized protein YbaR (Trm112 family)